MLLGLFHQWNFSIEICESWAQTDDDLDEENRVWLQSRRVINHIAPFQMVSPTALNAYGVNSCLLWILKPDFFHVRVAAQTIGTFCNLCSEFYPSKCTHTAVQWTNTHYEYTPRAVAAIFAATPKENLGARCLAQRSQLSPDIGCGRECCTFSLPTYNPCGYPRLKPATFGLQVRLFTH